MKGFTLVELLVVIAIIGVLAAVVILVINPLELIHRSRDATRLKDLDNLSQAINLALHEGSLSSNSIVSILCKETNNYSCSGKSNINNRLTDGTGWVKINFTSQNAIKVPTLPIDPVNDENYHYTYCADNDKWELNASLESGQLGYKVADDGGNSADQYEIGSDLFLIATSGGSCEY